MRPILILVLLGTGLELLGVPLPVTLAILVTAAVTGLITYRILKAQRDLAAAEGT